MKTDPGLENLRRALRRARLALISDEAHEAAKKADEQRAWANRTDKLARFIAKNWLGIELP